MTKIDFYFFYVSSYYFILLLSLSLLILLLDRTKSTSWSCFVNSFEISWTNQLAGLGGFFCFRFGCLWGWGSGISTECMKVKVRWLDFCKDYFSQSEEKIKYWATFHCFISISLSFFQIRRSASSSCLREDVGIALGSIV